MQITLWIVFAAIVLLVMWNIRRTGKKYEAEKRAEDEAFAKALDEITGIKRERLGGR